MPYLIENWIDLAPENWQTLIVGNGGSVAVSNGFAYASLYEAAEAYKLLTPAVIDIFEKFSTNDFELILRRLWYTKQVNAALGIVVAPVDNAYTAIRDALIKTIRETHLKHEDARGHLQTIYKFMRPFRTVISLNYDLLVYWAAQLGNDELGSRYHFKDCFFSGQFSDNWAEYRCGYGGINNPTIFCYPHGNIALGLTPKLVERKLAASVSGDLLEAIFTAWNMGTVTPIFVCEGSSAQKVDAIMASPYLRSVLSGPLHEIGESLVIYGWQMAKQEQHILDAIKKHPPTRVAVSVYDGSQPYCDHAHKTLTAAGIANVRFFDSKSPGAWNNPVP